MNEKQFNQSTSAIGFAGFSGSGKTTLLKKIIPVLKNKGLRVAVLKHAHHSFDIDTPGKDSYEVRQAGAQQVLIASKQRWALMVETPDQEIHPSLTQMLKQIYSSSVDIVLVEGFKSEAHPKIEVHRGAANTDFLYVNDPNIIAIATDTQDMLDTDLPLLDLNDAEQVSNFIIEHIK